MAVRRTEEHGRTGPRGDACHPSAGGEWFWTTLLLLSANPHGPSVGGREVDLRRNSQKEGEPPKRRLNPQNGGWKVVREVHVDRKGQRGLLVVFFFIFFQAFQQKMKSENSKCPFGSARNSPFELSCWFCFLLRAFHSSLYCLSFACRDIFFLKTARNFQTQRSYFEISKEIC